MINTLTLLLVALSLSCCTGQSMESIPSSSVVKRPGETLSLSCRGSGFTFSHYNMQWIRQHAGETLEWLGGVWSDASGTDYASSVRGRIEVSRDNSNSMMYLRLSNLQPEDSAVYYCARETGSYAFDYWGHGTEVTVTSATTASPAVFPLGSCDSVTGNEITLGCVAQDFYPKSVTFVWTTASGTKLDSHQYISTPKNNKYTGVSVIKVPASNSSYECSVKHPGGNQSVTVTYKGSSLSDWTEPKVTVHILPEEDIQQSDKEVTLVCLVSSSKMQNYDITWTEDIRSTIGDETDGINFPPQQTKNGYSVTSVFSTTKKNWDDGYTIKCNVRPVGRKDRKKLRGVSKAMNDPLDSEPGLALSCTDGSTDEDELSSLWFTSSCFIFLFIVSLFYNMIFSLVKMKKQ